MLGTLGKVMLFLFLVDMGLYIFADFIGGEDAVLIQNDLFRNSIKLERNVITGEYTNVSEGTLTSDVSGKLTGNNSGLQSSQTTGATTILNLFDPLFNTMRYIGLFFSTVINILAAPLTIMSFLLTKGMPYQIVLLIFAPLVVLTIIGIIGLLRGTQP